MLLPQPGIARYVQLADHLRRLIESGAMPAGSRVPSEDHLAQEHGMARETVRRALAVLRSEGLVDVSHGRGTRVRVRPERGEVAVQRGSRWLVRMPTAAERAELGVDEGVPVVELVHGGRVRLYAGDAHTFVTR